MSKRSQEGPRTPVDSSGVQVETHLITFSSLTTNTLVLELAFARLPTARQQAITPPTDRKHTQKKSNTRCFWFAVYFSRCIYAVPELFQTQRGGGNCVFAFKTRILEEFVAWHRCNHLTASKNYTKNFAKKMPSSEAALMISLVEQDPRNSRQERHEQ